MATKLTLTQNQLVTLAASIGICTILGLEKTAPAHSLFARKVKKVEDAIADLAKINKQDLSPEMCELGVAAWDKAMEYVAKHIKGMVEAKPTSKGGLV